MLDVKYLQLSKRTVSVYIEEDGLLFEDGDQEKIRRYKIPNHSGSSLQALLGCAVQPLSLRSVMALHGDQHCNQQCDQHCDQHSAAQLAPFLF